MYKIIRKNEQTTGEFDFGKIKERKPIGFYNEPGESKPFSCIFYWADAWSDDGGLIREHPHQGFEIISYVVKGSIEHYDSKGKQWITLTKGGMQVIKAGSGIYHAEKINANSEMFQIWFDPDLTETLKQPAEYKDYDASDAHVLNEDQNKIFRYLGENAPVKLVSPVKRIERIEIDNSIKIESNESNIAAFLINGKLWNESIEIFAGDFLVTDSDTIKLQGNGELFLVELPSKLSYRTYFEIRS